MTPKDDARTRQAVRTSEMAVSLTSAAPADCGISLRAGGGKVQAWKIVARVGRHTFFGVALHQLGPDPRTCFALWDRRYSLGLRRGLCLTEAPD